jgi:hypothetical protein
MRFLFSFAFSLYNEDTSLHRRHVKRENRRCQRKRGKPDAKG